MTQAPVSFMPEDYVEKRAQSRSNIICIGLFVVVMAGVGTAYYVQQRAIAAAEANNTQLTQQCSDMAKKLSQLDELKQQQQKMVEQFEVCAMLYEKAPRSRVCGGILLRKPKSVSLVSFDLHCRDLPTPAPSQMDQAKAGTDGQNAIERPPPKEVNVSITGLAATGQDVANYIKALGKWSALTDVNLGYSDEYKLQDETLCKFKIDMKLAPDVDLITGPDLSVSQAD